ncbi:MCE family protein [Plantactinospora soyae]|uniref:Virulence factor Mce-like protein n=1 Tax=Plantactinospora soyae TaxID=1544732 RepID=A0A927R085_9ACTN|nr:MCE family protein [Plantactinospora soyae]MBE1489917.1 virulence factor Mce-like protein [Plantactinospora soyae]
MRRPTLPSSAKRRRALLAAVLAVLVVAAAAVAVPYPGTPQRRLVAHFTRAVGVYVGSDVRVLGVRIGEVVAVVPEGRTVRIELRYDAKHDIPADASAVIVPPSLVSDRYVQLTPAYSGGDRLPDGADLPVRRTAAPMEIDDIYRALDDFNRALGPTGANADGALSDLLETGRANLAGSGAELHDTLDGLSRALATLAEGRQDLFGTVANLQQFTTALARSDQQVRSFNQQLADVAGQLAAERDDLAAALRNLAAALADVTGFIRQNRSLLKSNVDALADVTGVLARQQKAIIKILDVAPLALSNMNLGYNARSGTLDTRDNILGPYDPAAYVCAVLADLLPAPKVPRRCFELAQTLNLKRLPLPEELRKLLNLPPTTKRGPATPKPATPGPSGANPPAPAPSQGAPGPEVSLDRTLGGILRGIR